MLRREMPKGKYKEWCTEQGQTLLRGWKRQGLTDEQIAEKVGISCSTFYEWKNKYPEIAEALKKGKSVCDFEAEEALINAFAGHYVEDTVTEINKNAEGKEIKHVKKNRRWVEPNITAIIFYLKCRAGWRETTIFDTANDDDNDNVLTFINAMSKSKAKA